MIHNHGSATLSWNAIIADYNMTPIIAFDPILIADSGMFPVAFSAFPSSGTLSPACSTTIEVSFSAKLAQYEMSANLLIETESIQTAVVELKGVGASANLIFSTPHLDFDIVRVGSSKDLEFSVHNQGILSAPFFVESSSLIFSVFPEQGILHSNMKTSFQVKYTPQIPVLNSAKLNLSLMTNSEELSILKEIALNGQGSHPNLIVRTKLIDFHNALLNLDNIQYLEGII